MDTEINNVNHHQNLLNAKENSKDEFYTNLDVIEQELCHYKQYFNNKVVLCNCDDPYESDFFKYFALNFNELNLKKLICTSYDGSPFAYTQLSLFDDENADKPAKHQAYKIEINEVNDLNGDGAWDLNDVEKLLQLDKNTRTLLKEHGDFRSDECIEILKQADVVVTNPPFSLFREYFAQLMKYQKKFLILANLTAVTYKEFFPYLATNQVWMGYSIHSGDRDFRVPSDYSLNAANCYMDEDGIKHIRVKGIRWFTNLDYKERHEKCILYKTYTEDSYPKYDLYNAINVGNSDDVPYNFYGVIGVPISFLDKFCPEQFEIVAFKKRKKSNRNEQAEQLIQFDETEEEGPEFTSANINDATNDPVAYWQENGLMVPGDAMTIQNKRLFARLTIRRIDENDY